MTVLEKSFIGFIVIATIFFFIASAKTIVEPIDELTITEAPLNKGVQKGELLKSLKINELIFGIYNKDTDTFRITSQEKTDGSIDVYEAGFQITIGDETGFYLITYFNDIEMNGKVLDEDGGELGFASFSDRTSGNGIVLTDGKNTWIYMIAVTDGESTIKRKSNIPGLKSVIHKVNKKLFPLATIKG